MIKISKNISILLFSLFLMVNCSSLKEMSKEREINSIKHQIKKIEENIRNITNECNRLIISNRNLNNSALYISKEERNNKLNQNLRNLKQLRQQQIDNFKRMQYLKKSLNSLENPIEKNIRRSPTMYFHNPYLSGSSDLSDTDNIKPLEQPKPSRSDSLKGIELIKVEETDYPEAIIDEIFDKMDKLRPPGEFEPEIEVEHSSEDEIDICFIDISDFEKLKNYIETCEDINAQDNNGDTLLHQIIKAIIENINDGALFNKLRSLLKQFLGKNPNINTKNNNQNSVYGILNKEIKKEETKKNILYYQSYHSIENLLLNKEVEQNETNQEKLIGIFNIAIEREHSGIVTKIGNIFLTTLHKRRHLGRRRNREKNKIKKLFQNALKKTKKNKNTLLINVLKHLIEQI